MYKMTAHDGNTAYGIKEFVIDTAADLTTIPPCQMGSVALDISTSEVYMVNGNGEWVKL
jgi:hypothetical protein